MYIPWENNHDHISTDREHADSSLEDPGGFLQVLGVSPHYEDLSMEK